MPSIHILSTLMTTALLMITSSHAAPFVTTQPSYVGQDCDIALFATQALVQEKGGVQGTYDFAMGIMRGSYNLSKSFTAEIGLPVSKYWFATNETMAACRAKSGSLCDAAFGSSHDTAADQLDAFKTILQDKNGYFGNQAKTSCANMLLGAGTWADPKDLTMGLSLTGTACNSDATNVGYVHTNLAGKPLDAREQMVVMTHEILHILGASHDERYNQQKCLGNFIESTVTEESSVNLTKESPCTVSAVAKYLSQNGTCLKTSDISRAKQF